MQAYKSKTGLGKVFNAGSVCWRGDQIKNIVLHEHTSKLDAVATPVASTSIVVALEKSAVVESGTI